MILSQDGNASLSARAQMETSLRMQEEMIESSLFMLPDSSSSSNKNQYTPRLPCSVPASFPTTPAAIFQDRGQQLFKNFHTDTLFFIFYNQQGSYQQYLAAQQLKSKSWRFHKKYMTWFQRGEEPKVTTGDYEQGEFRFLWLLLHVSYNIVNLWVLQRKPRLIRFTLRFDIFCLVRVHQNIE